MSSTPQKIVMDLLDKGESQASIAEKIGVSQPTIYRISSGHNSDPRWSIYQRLIELHNDVCGVATNEKGGAA